MAIVLVENTSAQLISLDVCLFFHQNFNQFTNVWILWLYKALLIIHCKCFDWRKSGYLSSLVVSTYFCWWLITKICMLLEMMKYVKSRLNSMLFFTTTDFCFILLQKNFIAWKTSQFFYWVLLLIVIFTNIFQHYNINIEGLDYRLFL